MATLNDVIDYARFYGGSGEPPVFCHEHFDLDNKIFVATDDFKLAQKLTSHTVEDTAAFESGISAAIDMIQPDYICWYGKVFDFMEKYYDIHRIVRMQTRTELLRMYQKKCDADRGLYLPSLIYTTRRLNTNETANWPSVRRTGCGTT